jgi:hypothetical protein
MMLNFKLLFQAVEVNVEILLGEGTGPDYKKKCDAAWMELRFHFEVIL